VDPDAVSSDEVVESNRWFTLTSDEDGYAIWDVDDLGDDPVRFFEPTSVGSDDARAEFRRLTRDARLRRGVPRVLLGAVLVGAVVWLAAGSFYLFRIALQFGGGPSIDDFPTWLTWVQLVEGVAYRVGLGSLAVLLAWFVVESLRREPVRPSSFPARDEE
jgi:hypothetical protein